MVGAFDSIPIDASPLISSLVVAMPILLPTAASIMLLSVRLVACWFSKFGEDSIEVFF